MSKTLLVGNPYGNVFPHQDDIALPTTTARDVALKTLRKYYSELTFMLPGTPRVPFNIPIKSFKTEAANNIEMVDFPSIGVIPGEGEYRPTGLSTFLVEDSFDKYVKGTALQVMHDYNETFQLEIWCSHKPMRRSVIAGLEVVMSPTEALAGLRFRMPDYWDQTVTFSLVSTLLNDDRAGQGRFLAYVKIEMYLDIVRLVNATTLEPYVVVDVGDTPDILIG